jgi:hypothetical protein
MRRPLLLLLLLLPLLAGGCTARPPAAAEARAEEQRIFWERLQALCGRSYEGRVVEAPPGEETFAGAPLRMHVRECTSHEVRIPLQVGADTSRTWIVTRTESGLRLKHDHRLPDGTPDASNTDYGGHTRHSGSIWRQEFPADAYSISVVPARVSQLWYLELRPGAAFVYGLRREETGLRYRFEFDLAAR